MANLETKSVPKLNITKLKTIYCRGSFNCMYISLAKGQCSKYVLACKENTNTKSLVISEELLPPNGYFASKFLQWLKERNETKTRSKHLLDGSTNICTSQLLTNFTLQEKSNVVNVEKIIDEFIHLYKRFETAITVIFLTIAQCKVCSHFVSFHFIF